MNSLDVVSQVVSQSYIKSNKQVRIFCTLCDIFIDKTYFTAPNQNDVQFEAEIDDSNQLSLTVICPGFELTEELQSTEVINAFSLMMMLSKRVTIGVPAPEKLSICFALSGKNGL